MEENTLPLASPPAVEGSGNPDDATDQARRQYFELIESLREGFDREQWQRFLELRRVTR